MMDIDTKELARANEGTLIEILCVLYRLKFPNKAKVATIAEELFGVSAPNLRDAIANKTYLGIRALLQAEGLLETDLVSRFFKAKGGKP